MNLVHTRAYNTSLRLLVVATILTALPTWAGPKPTAYERLGISESASDEDVKAAFHRAWGNAGFFRALSEPSLWRARLSALNAYLRIGSTMSRDRYDEKIDRAADVAQELAQPEELVIKELRARHMPDFVTPEQLEALALATHAFGSRAVAWHLEKLLTFTTEPQVRALGIAIRATGADAQNSLVFISRFTSASSVEALEALATVLGPRLQFRYAALLSLTSPVQVEALGVLTKTLSRRVEPHLHYVARIERPEQVEALRIVTAAIGSGIEYELGKLNAFVEAAQIQALAIAAPVLKNQLTFHLTTLSKFTKAEQVEALRVATERLGVGIQDLLPDLQSFSSQNNLALLIDLPENDASRFKSEVRKLARSCRKHL